MSVNFLASITPLTRLTEEEIKIPYRLRIRGVAVDSSVNRNNWKISNTLLEKIVEDLKKTTIRVNHGDSVTDVIGRILEASLEGDKVVFEGEIIGSDPTTAAVKEKIMNGLLDSVSIGMDGFKVVCSICGKETRAGNSKIHDPAEHDTPGHEIILDGAVRELSVVLDPAYKNTKINISNSFASAMEAFLGPVTPPKEGVTYEVGDDQEGRPADKTEERGDNMAAVIPTAEPSEAKAPTLEEITKIIQDAFGKMDSRFAEIENKLKNLEAELAKRDKEDEEMESEITTAEAKLAKSTTYVGSAPSADWVAELEAAIKKAQSMR